MRTALPTGRRSGPAGTVVSVRSTAVRLRGVVLERAAEEQAVVDHADELRVGRARDVAGGARPWLPGAARRVDEFYMDD